MVMMRDDNADAEEEKAQPMRWCKQSEYGGEVDVAKEQVKGEECAGDHVLQQKTSVQFQLLTT